MAISGGGSAAVGGLRLLLRVPLAGTGAAAGFRRFLSAGDGSASLALGVRTRLNVIFFDEYTSMLM
jgi:hypothetical protein